VRTGLAVTVRSASDADSGGEVRQIDLASVPAAEGVRLHVRLPGVGVSWPTQVSERAAFKAFFTAERGLFFNRWGGNIQAVCDELARPADHPFVYTAESDITNADFKFPDAQPQTGKRALVGGYHDAGDFDQRPFHTVVAQLLMRAYELNPAAYPDGQLDIPESGNGIPDLLDEAMWGVASWVQLQEADGGVRMGVESSHHPNGFYHADKDQLVYWTYSRDPRTTARVAGLFAQASRLIAPFDATKAADLRSRAVKAFDWAVANAAPASFRLYGASELFLLTGDSKYDTAFQAAWNQKGSSGAFSNIAEFQLQFGDYMSDAQVSPDYILDYAKAPGASPAIVSMMKTWFASLSANWIKATHDNHAHRNPRPGQYVMDWGMGVGTARFMDTLVARMQMGDASAADQQKMLNTMSLAADYVLGGNPNGLVYYTLLGSRRIEEPLHLDSLAWVKEGVGPAPGIPAYGPVEDLGSASYMAPAKAAFYPAFNTQPRALRFGDVRTLVPTAEFSVWEMMAPGVEMFAMLSKPGQMPPADWMTGMAQHNAPLP
jgi:endoglucanase